LQYQRDASIIALDKHGNVWIAEFAGNKSGTEGHQLHKFSPNGEKLLSLVIAGKAGNADGEFNQMSCVPLGFRDSKRYTDA
jgi:hypothetical protein